MHGHCRSTSDRAIPLHAPSWPQARHALSAATELVRNIKLPPSKGTSVCSTSMKEPEIGESICRIHMGGGESSRRIYPSTSLPKQLDPNRQICSLSCPLSFPGSRKWERSGVIQKNCKVNRPRVSHDSKPWSTALL